MALSLSRLIEQIDAYRRGRPVARGQTLSWPRTSAGDCLIVAFVRMAGESLPWGVALGRPGEAPAVFSVTEPRDPAAHATFCRAWAPMLLEHLPHPMTASDEERADPEAACRRKQLWLPGPSHVEMLHFLDYRYTLARQGAEVDLKVLRALGRSCGWLFRESTRPGQVRVYDATSRLTEAFAFPADEARRAHLGFLLAWLGAAGDRAARQAAAAEAEQWSMATTMAPELERASLAPLLARVGQSRGTPAAAAVEGQVSEILSAELSRRWKLAEAAYVVLDGDPRPANPQLEAILALGASEFLHQCWSLEQKALDPERDVDELKREASHPETDFLPQKAACRYFEHLHAHELQNAELIHGDPDRVEAAIDAGDGLRGEIERVVDEGPGRRSTPVWTLVAGLDDALRLREESGVCVAGRPWRKGRIRAIRAEAGRRLVEVEVTEGLRGRDGEPAAGDASLVGREVVLLDDVLVGLSKKKAREVWNASGPGAWLTHAAPLPEPLAPPSVHADLVAVVESMKG